MSDISDSHPAFAQAPCSISQDCADKRRSAALSTLSRRRRRAAAADLRGAPDPARAPVRPAPRGANLTRVAAAAPAHRRLRRHASAPPTALPSGRRFKRVHNHHDQDQRSGLASAPRSKPSQQFFLPGPFQTDRQLRFASRVLVGAGSVRQYGSPPDRTSLVGSSRRYERNEPARYGLDEDWRSAGKPIRVASLVARQRGATCGRG